MTTKSEIDSCLDKADTKIERLRNTVMAAKHMTIIDRPLNPGHGGLYHIGKDIRLLMKILDLFYRPGCLRRWNGRLGVYILKASMSGPGYAIMSCHGFYVNYKCDVIDILILDEDKFIKSVDEVLGVKLEIKGRPRLDNDGHNKCFPMYLSGKLERAIPEPGLVRYIRAPTDMTVVCQE